MAELLVTLEDLNLHPCVCGAAEGCACPEWTDAEELAHWDRVVRREVARALEAAREDIRQRRRTFIGLHADPQYINALDDAFGLVNNRLRDAQSRTGS